jgi:hypothetical protein
MELFASGLVVSVVLGALAMAVVMRSTRGRRHPPLARGRVERAIEYGAGVGGGLLILLALLVLYPEVTPASQEAALLGVAVAMPVSAAATWLTGELTAGPTQRSWQPMVLAFLAAQAGFIGAFATLSWLDQHLLRAVADEAREPILAAELVMCFFIGGLASTWVYRRWRKDVAPGP